jgi:multiple sugar transport system permease protein
MIVKYKKRRPTAEEKSEWRRLRKKEGRFMRRQEQTAYIFIAAPMLLFILFTLLPTIMSFPLSFTNYDVIQKHDFVGLKNYVTMFSDTLFWKYMGNTVFYSILFVPICFAVSLFTAMLLSRAKFGVAMFRLCFYFPVVSSAVAYATIWLWLLNPQSGAVNVILSKFGIMGPAWLQDSNYAMIAIVIITVWANIGTNMMIFLAGLKDIPVHLYESARIDGANGFQEFISITLPGLGPTIFFVSVILIIQALQLFDQVFVLTQGGPGGSTKPIVYYIYDEGFGLLKMGYASAISFVLFVVIMLASLLNMRFNKDSSQLV